MLREATNKIVSCLLGRLPLTRLQFRHKRLQLLYLPPETINLGQLDIQKVLSAHKIRRLAERLHGPSLLSNRVTLRIIDHVRQAAATVRILTDDQAAVLGSRERRQLRDGEGAIE